MRKLSSIEDPDEPRLISLDKAGFNPKNFIFCLKISLLEINRYKQVVLEKGVVPKSGTIYVVQPEVKKTREIDN